jgi:dolichol-phosphate mannosyltransferase
MAITYSIIVPVYNEETVLPEFYHQLKSVMDSLGEPYELIFVDDGSSDTSFFQIRSFAEKDAIVRGISFSRNFGQDIAVHAGIDHASGSAVILIDADLQVPPGIIPKLIQEWKNGAEVVLPVREKRMGELWTKKITSYLFYLVMKYFGNLDIPANVGHSRLMDKKVIEMLKNTPERNRFFRGLVSWGGFKTAYVPFICEKRYAGKTKYTFFSRLRLAFQGIFDYSVIPLRLATYFGMLVSFMSLIYAVYATVCRLLNLTVSGWTSLVIIVTGLGGVQLITIGIIGEYLGRIYYEVKQRPLYILRERIGFPNNGVLPEEKDHLL